MGIAKRIAQFGQAVNRAAGDFMSIADLDAMMEFRQFGQPSYTGKMVSQSTALGLPAVWACINARANDYATLKKAPYRRTGPVTRELAHDHYLYPLLTHQANPEMTSWRFFHVMQCFLDLGGNAYAELVINGRGQVTQMWPWRPDRVRIKRDSENGPLLYQYRNNKGVWLPPVPQHRMLHVRGLSVDGVLGLSPMDVHRQTVGIGLALQEHGGRFFGNGTQLRGVLKTPGKIKDPELLRKSWNEVYGGLQNSHRVAILEEGLEFQSVTSTLLDAQWIESQDFSGKDLARIYGMPPHRVGFMSDATYSNITQQSIEYVQFSMGPNAGNWEAELGFALLSDREADDIFISTDFSSLLRGDLQAQAVFYPAMINSGIWTPDEAREAQGMNPHPDGMGDKPIRPMNMATADQADALAEQAHAQIEQDNKASDAKKIAPPAPTAPVKPKQLPAPKPKPAPKEPAK